MRLVLQNTLILICAALLALGGFTEASAQSSSGTVRTAVDALHGWVGKGENGMAWRRFLLSDQLAEQLNKGSSAEKDAIVKVLATYSSATPGLDQPQFVAVRTALQQWLDEVAPPTLDELSKTARAAKESFVPLTDDAAQQTRAELVSSVVSLDQALARADAVQRGAWKQYLLWNDLLKEVSGASPADLTKLKAVLAKYTSAEPGLDWQPVSRVRAALRNHVNVLVGRADGKTPDTYATTIDDLAQRLETYAKTPSSDDAVAIGRALGWLKQTRQAPGLVRSVRRHYGNPNLLVQASRNLVGAGVDDQIDDVTPLQENIMGTYMEGTAHTTGRVSAELVPNDERAALNILLRGSTASQTVGWKGPVTIYAHGVTQVIGTKRLTIDADGLNASGPASACCDTQSVIDDICARCGLIERVAWKQAGKKKGQAESIANGRAESRVAGRMDTRAGEMLQKPNESFAEKFRKPLLSRDEFPREMRLSTTADRLNVRVTQANDSQLAAPSAPPDVAGSHDLIVRAHESIVGNFSEAILGGTTLTDEKLEKFVLDATGEVPEELKIGPDKDEWSITFPSEEPISVRFANQELRIAIIGQRFNRGGKGGQDIKNPMRIAATYKFEKTPTGSKLTRKGDLEVDYVGHKGTLSATQVTFKTFMRRKFESLLKPEIVSEGIKLPGRWEKAGKLRIEEMTSDKGWLAAAWQLAPNAAPATAAQDSSDNKVVVTP